MAQPPHKPEPKKPDPKPEVKEEPTKSEEEEVEVKLPGGGPLPAVAEQHQNHQPLSPATRAEQEAGKKASEEAANRLQAEQDAGAEVVKHNSSK